MCDGRDDVCEVSKRPSRVEKNIREGGVKNARYGKGKSADFSA